MAGAIFPHARSFLPLDLVSLVRLFVVCCLLDLKALIANATSARVSIYRDAGQYAENVHSQIRKQQGSRLRAYGVDIQLPSNRR